MTNTNKNKLLNLAKHIGLPERYLDSSKNINDETSKKKTILAHHLGNEAENIYVLKSFELMDYIYHVNSKELEDYYFVVMTHDEMPCKIPTIGLEGHSKYQYVSQIIGFKRLYHIYKVKWGHSQKEN